MPNTRAEEFCRKASECRQKAEKAVRSADKSAWLDLAEGWLKLARSENLKQDWLKANNDGSVAEKPIALPPATKEAHEWQRISTAPFDSDLELAVIDYDGVHALVFPCRRILTGWLKSGTQEQINVRPTHWREWNDA